MDRKIAKLALSPFGPVVLGITYFCSADLALTLTSGRDGIATVWPPSGILLATLLMVPRRMIWRYASAALLASFGANLVVGASAALAAGFTAANLIEALIATVLLRQRAGCRVSFVDLQGVGCFAVSTFVAALLSASVALSVNSSHNWHFFVSWFATVWLGMLLITPPLMVVYEAAASIRKVFPAISVAALVQIAVLSAVVCAFTFFQSVFPLLFLPMMVAIAAVVHAGALGGIIVVAVATVLGSWALPDGYGPVSLIDAGRQTQVLFFQFYLVALFFSALPLARLLAGKERLRIDLAERMRLLDQAEQAGHIGHWRVSPAEQTVYWSPEVFRIHGVTTGSPPTMADAIGFYHPEDRSIVEDVVARAVADGRAFNFNARIIRGDGSIRHVVSRGERDFSSKDDAIGLFGILQDVTDQVEARDRLAAARDVAERSAKEALALADTDPLTGVANRRCLIRELSVAVEAGQPDLEMLSVIMFDVDHFKSVNDHFGHDVGDEVLKRVAASAAHCLRGTDLIGRYGGEEFFLLLPNTGSAAAEHVAERVRIAVEGSGAPGSPTVTISLGVATLRCGETAQAILKRADLALYAAKAAGRNRLRLAA
ncbi:diguanylate cyclase [Sphingomonas sp. RB3P16]|uniref:sensor domain-containing diguanylate cyclase n=1 Tax=Parasphingomonas frigoris TaxID=3096163 RepID=UPI002FC6800C